MGRGEALLAGWLASGVAGWEVRGAEGYSLGSKGREGGAGAGLEAFRHWVPSHSWGFPSQDRVGWPVSTSVESRR